VKNDIITAIMFRNANEMNAPKVLSGVARRYPLARRDIATPNALNVKMIAI
jgi:hypothetical protein